MEKVEVPCETIEGLRRKKSGDSYKEPHKHEHIFVCIAPYTWGVGSTQEDAVKECEKQHPPKGTRLIRIVPADATPYVDEMGSTTRYLDCPFCGIEWIYTSPSKK